MLKTITYFSKLAFYLFKGSFSLRKYIKNKNNYSQEEYLSTLYSDLQKYTSKIINNTGSSLTIIGKENIITDRPVVFVPNHQSYFDIPALFGAIDVPIAFISKKETLKLPVISTAIVELNSITFDRSNIKEAAKSVLSAIKILKSGQSMVIFPEGTRSKDSNVNEFKAGAFKIATKPKVPIVPVSIIGARDVFEANNFKIRKSDIKIIFHDPIYTENLTKEEIKQLPEKVHKIVSDSVISNS